MSIFLGIYAFAVFREFPLHNVFHSSPEAPDWATIVESYFSGVMDFQLYS